MTTQPVGRTEIVHLFGDIDDHKVVEILETGANLVELEEAAAWLAEESDVMGELRKPLMGKAALVHEIVSRGEEEDEDSARR